MSSLIEKREEFDKLLKSREKVLVLFYASWCPFSRMFLRLFEKTAEGRRDKFCRILADEMEGCEDQYSINVFPTVIYFENGKIAKRLDGIAGSGIDENAFKKMVNACGLSGNQA